jgi:nicotinamidase-related amidase
MMTGWSRRLIVVGLLALSGCAAARTHPIELADRPATALVVMDMQRDFLEDAGRMPVSRDQVSGVIVANNRLIDFASRSGLPVIYVVNAFAPSDIANLFRRGAAVAGTPGAALDSRLHVIGDWRIAKTEGSAFGNPQMDALLQRLQVGRLIITGVYAGGCVSDTVRAALQRGYAVTVVRDAVADAGPGQVDGACDALRRQGATVTDSQALSAAGP